MSNEKNTNTNVEKKDATVVAHDIKGTYLHEERVIQNHWSFTRKRFRDLLNRCGGFFSNLKKNRVNS